MLPKAKPAQADRQRFQLHPSVNTWRTFDPAAAIDDDSSLVNQVQSALQVCYHAVVYQALLLRCTGSLPNAAAIILVKCDRKSSSSLASAELAAQLQVIRNNEPVRES